MQYKKLLLILSSLLLISILGFTLYNIYTSQNIEIKNLTAEETSNFDENEKPLGNIFMTLAPKTEDGKIANYPVVYDLEKQKVIYTFAEKLKNSKYPAALLHSFSSTGNFATFLGLSDNGKIKQVYRSDMLDINDPAQIVADLQSGISVNKFMPEDAREPNVNNVGEILFYALETKANESEANLVEDYGIYITYLDIESNNFNTVRIATGAKPKWVADNKYIYLKNNGIFVNGSGFKEDEAKQISKAFNGQSERADIKISAGLTVSRDATLVAMSDIDSSDLTLFRVNNWEEPILETVASILVNGFWPLISPDNNFIALQTIDSKDTIKIDPQPRVEFYKIAKEGEQSFLKKLKYEIDLDKFYQDYMFLGDWLN